MKVFKKPGHINEYKKHHALKLWCHVNLFSVAVSIKNEMWRDVRDTFESIGLDLYFVTLTE